MIHFHVPQLLKKVSKVTKFVATRLLLSGLIMAMDGFIAGLPEGKEVCPR
jgi:hypothetical protein